MTIKHLVLPGGGAAAIRLLGALQSLHENKVWNHNDIESIHAVSAGTLLAVLIALKFDWDTIVDYMIQRPWGDVFKVSLTNIFDVFIKKGFFNTEMFVTFLKPFFDSKDIKLDISLKEFYELTKVELYFYTVEINNFQLVQISHKTFPDLQVMKAIHMSAAYPVMLSPVIIDNNCYVDGGIICNYPINYCLDLCEDKNEILGIGSAPTNTKKNIDDTSSLLEYIMELIYKMVTNIFDRVKDIEKREEIPNYVSIHIPSITIGDIQDAFTDIELRTKLLQEGKDSANKFLTELTYNESSTITSISSTSSELDSLDGLDGSCHSDSDTQTNTILSSIEQNQSFDSTNIEYSNNFSYNDLPIF